MLLNQEEINKINKERIRKMEEELEMLDDQLEGLEIKKPVMTEGYPYICRCDSYRKKKYCAMLEKECISEDGECDDCPHTIDELDWNV